MILKGKKITTVITSVIYLSTVAVNPALAVTLLNTLDTLNIPGVDTSNTNSYSFTIIPPNQSGDLSQGAGPDKDKSNIPDPGSAGASAGGNCANEVEDQIVSVVKQQLDNIKYEDGKLGEGIMTGIPGGGGGGGIQVYDTGVITNTLAIANNTMEIVTNTGQTVNNTGYSAFNTALVADNTAKLVAKEVGGGLSSKLVEGIVNDGPSLDAVAYCMVNKIVEKIVKDTRNWVQTGYSKDGNTGNPTYVTNVAAHLRSIAKNEADQYVREITASEGNGDTAPRLGHWERQTTVELQSQDTSGRPIEYLRNTNGVNEVWVPGGGTDPDPLASKALGAQTESNNKASIFSGVKSAVAKMLNDNFMLENEYAKKDYSTNLPKDEAKFNTCLDSGDCGGVPISQVLMEVGPLSAYAQYFDSQEALSRRTAEAEQSSLTSLDYGRGFQPIVDACPEDSKRDDGTCDYLALKTRAPYTFISDVTQSREDAIYTRLSGAQDFDSVVQKFADLLVNDAASRQYTDKKYTEFI